VPQTSFLQEARAAARGVGALVVGRRDAHQRFDLTPSGVAGSLVALLLVMAINSAMPMFFGQSGVLLRAVLNYAILFVVQMACAYVALRQLNRVDGFLPFVVADNWASVYVTIGALALSLVGVSEEIMSLPLAVLILVISINIGRLIVTLQPLQVAMFVIAQMVGALVGSFLADLVLPLKAVVAQ
jgi:hypothetical protein